MPESDVHSCHAACPCQFGGEPVEDTEVLPLTYEQKFEVFTGSCVGCGVDKDERCEPGCPEYARRVAASGRFE